jgi:tryptophanyl-tRNA synthetase
VDVDADVSMGLFMDPVLMGADILCFKAHKVPVGRDPVQHLAMARDMAQSFNHLYGEHLVLPEAEVDEAVALLPGLDGRKMSKSYDNVIGLFAPREQVRKAIFSIVTDSRAPGEPKDTEGSALFQIYQASPRRPRRRNSASATPRASPGRMRSSCCSTASTRRSAPCVHATSTWSRPPRNWSASCRRAPPRRARARRR